jgi:hypothetical protein
MADNEVNVKLGGTQAATRRRFSPLDLIADTTTGKLLTGLTPKQSSLLAGGVLASVFGPVGLLAGAGAGILSKKLRQNQTDREMDEIANIRAEHVGITQEIDSELKIADPDEARLLQHAKRMADEGWYRLASGDDAGRAMIDKANEISLGIMSSDRDARKQEQSAQAGFQRGLIGQAANDYRTQFQANMALTEDLDRQAARVLDLTSDPNFDPNKPFNKAILAELLSTGIGGFYKDSPDVLDAVSQGAGSIGSILGARGGPGGAAIGGELGSIVGALTNGLKSKDFQVSKEEYNRIAFNMRKVAAQYGSQRMQRLSQQSDSLNQFAQSVGAVPQDYHISDFVSGGVKDLKLLPVPQMPGPKQAAESITRLDGLKAPPSEKYVGGANSVLRGVESWLNKRKTRPTN